MPTDHNSGNAGSIQLYVKIDYHWTKKIKILKYPNTSINSYMKTKLTSIRIETIRIVVDLLRSNLMAPIRIHCIIVFQDSRPQL